MEQSTVGFVEKRDGRIVRFNIRKIEEAIFKAAQAVGGRDEKEADRLSRVVENELVKKFEGRTPKVEEIQDVIEKVLIEEGHAKTAKSYILYREKHRAVRELKSTMVDVNDTISEYLHQTDWRVKEISERLLVDFIQA